VHADRRREPRRRVRAAVDPAPQRQPLRNAPAVVRRPAAVGDDLVAGAMDLEHRQRALRPARRQRTVAAGHRRHAREPLGQLASQPRRHATAVRHAGDEHPRRVHARCALELAERALERVDVVGGAGDRSAHVPERMRARRRWIGDEEVLAVGQRAEAGVPRELRPRLAGAVQREHERHRAVGAARSVQVHGTDALGRVDAQQVIARRQRRARLVRGRGGVVDRERSCLPGDKRHRGKADDDRGGGPRARHAKTQPRHSAKVSSVTAGRIATWPSRRCRCPSPTTSQTPSASSPAPSACTAT
jgi:hypothetical protein